MSEGRWVETDVAWHTISVRACAVCGKLITRRAWVLDLDAGPLDLCGQECEELLDSYYVPTHGLPAPAKQDER